MYSSDKHGFCYLHNPKTGGTSTTAALYEAVPDFVQKYHLVRNAKSFGAKLDALGLPREPRSALMFVRNPWDRVVSWYCMSRMYYARTTSSLQRVCQDCGAVSEWKLFEVLPTGELVSDVCAECGEMAVQPNSNRVLDLNRPTLWARLHSAPVPDFETFVQVFLSHEFGERAQTELCLDEGGTTRLATLGRFENLEADLNAFLAERGVGPAKLPQKNPTLHAHYSTFHTEATKAAVAKAFASDIEEFGYEFQQG